MSERCGTPCVLPAGHLGVCSTVILLQPTLALTSAEVTERVAAERKLMDCEHPKACWVSGNLVTRPHCSACSRERASAEVMRLACAEAARDILPGATIAQLAGTGPELLRAYVDKEVAKVITDAKDIGAECAEAVLQSSLENNSGWERLRHESTKPILDKYVEREVKAAVAVAYRRCAKWFIEYNLMETCPFDEWANEVEHGIEVKK